MTNERREEVVLVALVLSVAIHAGLMLLVRPQVMTQVRPVSPSAHRAPMVAREAVERPEPVRIETVADEVARKDAPAVVEDRTASVGTMPALETVRTEVPEVRLPPPPRPEQDAAPAFDVKPVGLEKAGVSVQPLMRLETPKAAPAAVSAPAFSVRVPVAARPAAPAAPATGGRREPGAAFLPTRLTRGKAPEATFTPAKEIYAKVDEKVVAEEKRAVRRLVENEEAADLQKFVNVTMKAADAGGWRYFRVMLTPRANLAVVPKDVVVIIDGSGSIGNDRLGSCRKAARRILRTATNTGDRFNLVVFRNAFSYAFRSWRDCDAASFAAGDRWLSNQTAHGRTDIFSTISSVLTLPRDPKRPLVALVVTDGDANSGVSDTADILSWFTALNDGLVSVYMYGVKESANRELIDVLTHGNRGESFVFEGWRWNAGEGMESLSDRFRDPVLSDLRVIFSAGTPATAYPRLLRNLSRGATLDFVGRVPEGTPFVAFSLKGLNGDTAYEGFFKLPFESAPRDEKVVSDWQSEQEIAHKLGIDTLIPVF